MNFKDYESWLRAQDYRHRVELAILEHNRGARIGKMCWVCILGHLNPCTTEGCKCLCNDIRPANLKPVPQGEVAKIEYGSLYPRQ
jgi:hypothetical protein